MSKDETTDETAALISRLVYLRGWYPDEVKNLLWSFIEAEPERHRQFLEFLEKRNS